MPQTIYGGKDFARQFRVVRNNTLQIAEDVPESKYGFVPAPGSRTVAALLTHIAVAPRMWFEVHGRQRVKSLVGFDFVKLGGDVSAEEVRSRSKAEILDLLRREGEEFAGWLDTLTPEFLAEMVTVADNTGTKSRFEQLLGAKEHENRASARNCASPYQTGRRAAGANRYRVRAVIPDYHSVPGSPGYFHGTLHLGCLQIRGSEYVFDKPFEGRRRRIEGGALFLRYDKSGVGSMPHFNDQFGGLFR